MSRRPALLQISLALLIACASHTDAADAPDATPLARLEKALADSPDDPTLAYFLAVHRMNAQDRAGAIAALARALHNGDGFLPTADLFGPLVGDPAFEALRARFAERLPRRVTGTVTHMLDARTLLPEGIAWDPVERALYVGSIAQHGIFRVAGESSLHALSRPSDDLDAVLGLRIDAKRRLLYAISTNAITDAGRARPRNAVKVYDLRTRRLVRTLPVPGAAQLNDVDFADGMLLATDSAAGAVYRIDLDDGRARALVPPSGVPGANGIAVVPGKPVAYVAASRRPGRIDLVSGTFTPLVLPPRETAALIDGLYWHGGDLIGIQNTTTPGRVVRLRLAPDGVTVGAVETLESSHQPAFEEPTTGAIAGDAMYLLARTDVSRFNARGELDSPDTIREPLILRIPIPD
jgi:hypothetical protein